LPSQQSMSAKNLMGPGETRPTIEWSSQIRTHFYRFLSNFFITSLYFRFHAPPLIYNVHFVLIYIYCFYRFNPLISRTYNLTNT
jgi:hypothetical protein